MVGEKYLRPGRYSCPDWARPGVPDHSVTYRSALRSSISLPASQLSRDHLATAVADGLREITARLLPPPRRRSNPRVVKRKMSNFGVKCDEHRNRPQPTRDPADTGACLLLSGLRIL